MKQLMEKRLHMQGEMAVGFVDLEEAYDTVPRSYVDGRDVEGNEGKSFGLSWDV